MAERHLAAEPALLKDLLKAARLEPASRTRVVERARRLIETTRKPAAIQGGLEPFLQEYRLSGAEGIVLLTLAESLLRVPDQATQDELIRDKLAQGDWRSHLGASPSRLVNLASRALTFSREWVEAGDGQQGVLARLLAAGGEPLRRRVLAELTDRLLELTVAARDAGLSVAIDAEEAERLDLSLDIIAKVLAAPELVGYEHFGVVVQAYQKRARPVIEWAAALTQARRTPLRIRLVKGAYWDTEIKAAQERGLEGYPVFTRKTATDVSYLACAHALLAAPRIFPAFATHNALTVATLLDWTGPRRDFEFQRLLGMGAGLYESLIKEQGLACRIYAPVGTHGDLLAYLARRLLENGANTSFVNQVTDPHTRLDMCDGIGQQ